MHYVENVEKEDYIKMLDFLAKNCDTFSLVEGNAGIPDYPDELPDTKKALAEYLKAENRVTSWPGTEIDVRIESGKALEHVYGCCKGSVEQLKKSSSFFEIEEEWDMDISFFKSGQCVLFTISHEGILMVDLDFWQDFFDGSAWMLTKAKPR